MTGNLPGSLQETYRAGQSELFKHTKLLNHKMISVIQYGPLVHLAQYCQEMGVGGWVGGSSSLSSKTVTFSYLSLEIPGTNSTSFATCKAHIFTAELWPLPIPESVWETGLGSSDPTTKSSELGAT